MIRVEHNDLRQLFINLGVKKDKTVMIHGFMPSFGVIDGGHETFFSVLFELVGAGGGVIVPTFTYSFTKGEVYDVRNTESTVGGFTNYFLTLNGCYRNLEPNFSMAGIGKNVRELIYWDKGKIRIKTKNIVL